MPERWNHQGAHPGTRPYSLAEAAKANMLVAVTCRKCRRCIHYLASDLVALLDPSRPAAALFSTCRTCKTRDYMKVAVRQVHPGDLGQLMVRRPGKPRMVRDWKDVPL